MDASTPPFPSRTELALLRVLSRQGIPVDDESRQRIMSCTDIATLDQWLDRALGATRLSEVLGDMAQ